MLEAELLTLLWRIMDNNIVKQNKQNKFDFLKKLNRLLDRKDKIQFLGVIAIGLISALFQTLSVASVLPFINLVVNPETVSQNNFLMNFYNFFNFSSSYSFTVFLGFIILGIIIVSNFLSAFTVWFKIRFIWKKNHNLSLDLLRKYLSLPYVCFLDRHSADLGKNILSEVERLTGQLFMPLLSLITSLTTVLVILALLVFVNPSAAFISVFLFVLFYGIIFFYLRGSLKERGRRRLEENKGRYTSVGEALEGIKDIKVLGREKYFLERFSYHSQNSSWLESWNHVITNLPRYIMEIVAFGGIITFILILISLGRTGKEIIPLISFFVFAGYRLMPALQEIFRSLTSFQFNKAVLNKIYYDIHEPGISHNQELDQDRKPPDPLSFQKSISFNQVSFSYPNKKDPVLENIDFQIAKGSSVGIVGPTGGGKTTLVDLILGLFTPNQGTMEVDGIKIEEENVRNWQRNIGYVPQQVYLSDDTIARNIAFGVRDEDIDMAQVKRVAEIANIRNFIENELPFGYNTFVGEKGIRLSGGQKQRISIARAIYHNPEVLVLDEATSSLDGTTEKAVLEAINNVAKLKTLIIVAHRLKTVERCDTLYFLDKGRIIDQGNYQKLLESNHQFKKMARGVV